MQASFRVDDLVNYWISYPSLSEQTIIANFLDRETTKIDNLISKQQKLISLLQEKRQAVISHAVTKGINPDAKMKDSGVEWLGEVPEDWELPKLKHIAMFSGGGTPSKDNLEYWQGNIPWVSPKDMKIDNINDTQDKITQKGLVESSTNLVKTGQVLIVVRSGILQRTIPVAINMVPVTLNQDMKAIHLNHKMLPNYLFNVIKGCEASLLLLWRKQGATVESLGHEYLSNSIIPLPSKQEQATIITYLDHEITKIDKLIIKANDAVSLLQERRTALISATVTGKIDVRNA